MDYFKTQMKIGKNLIDLSRIRRSFCPFLPLFLQVDLSKSSQVKSLLISYISNIATYGNV